VKELCVPALAHRLTLAGRGEAERTASERVVREIVEQVPAPE
jgi:MoxR-like ATPase